jgi:hypothetical protein
MPKKVKSIKTRNGIELKNDALLKDPFASLCDGIAAELLPSTVFALDSGPD